MAIVHQLSLCGTYLKPKWMPLKAFSCVNGVWAKTSATVRQLMWSCSGSVLLDWFNTLPLLCWLVLQSTEMLSSAGSAHQHTDHHLLLNLANSQQPSKGLQTNKLLHFKAPQTKSHPQFWEQTCFQTKESPLTLGAKSCPALQGIKGLSWVLKST